MYRCLGLFVPALMLSSAASADRFYVSGSVGVSAIDDVAEISTPAPLQFGDLPDGLSVNGWTFDSEETAYGLTVGWRARDWVAIELGYADLGEAEGELRFSPLGTAVFRPNPAVLEIDPNTTGFISIYDSPGVVFFNPNPPRLGIEEWSLALKFSHALVSKLSANWSVGISRVEFDADGQRTFIDVLSRDPLVTEEISIPYTPPDDETGFRIGVGFAWQFNDRLSADLGYQRHDTQVLNVDTVSLELILSL